MGKQSDAIIAGIADDIAHGRTESQRPMSDLDALLGRMTLQFAEWDMDEPRGDWWQYQRDFAEAHDLLARTNNHAELVEAAKAVCDEAKGMSMTMRRRKIFDRLALSLYGGEKP